MAPFRSATVSSIIDWRVMELMLRDMKIMANAGFLGIDIFVHQQRA